MKAVMMKKQRYWENKNLNMKMIRINIIIINT